MFAPIEPFRGEIPWGEALGSELPGEGPAAGEGSMDPMASLPIVEMPEVPLPPVVEIPVTEPPMIEPPRIEPPMSVGGSRSAGLAPVGGTARQKGKAKRADKDQA